MIMTFAIEFNWWEEQLQCEEEDQESYSRNIEGEELIGNEMEETKKYEISPELNLSKTNDAHPLSIALLSSIHEELNSIHESKHNDGSLRTPEILEDEQSQQHGKNHQSSRSKPKLSRWSRSKDKLLFIKLRELENQGKLDLQELFLMKNYPKFKNKMLKQVCVEMGWKDTQRKLLRRIDSLMKNTFSVREAKVIARLARRSKYKNLDYEKILDSFPGKSIEAIIKACEIICKSKKEKKLTGIELDKYCY